LPDEDSNENRRSLFDAVIVDHLQELRRSPAATHRPGPSRQKRLKLNVVSGKAVGDDIEPEDVSQLFHIALDETNDSESSGTIEADESDNTADAQPGAASDFESEFVIIKLQVQGKNKHKFFAAMTVNTNPLTVNFMKRLSKSTFAFPENDDPHEVQDGEILGPILMTPDRRGMIWTAMVDFDEKVSELCAQQQ